VIVYLLSQRHCEELDSDGSNEDVETKSLFGSLRL